MSSCAPPQHMLMFLIQAQIIVDVGVLYCTYLELLF